MPGDRQPLARLAVAAVIGICLTHTLRLHPHLLLAVLILAGGGLGWCLVHIRCQGPLAPRWFAVLLIFLAAWAGWRYGMMRAAAPGSLESWLDQYVTVSGVARDIRRAKERWRAVVWTDTIISDNIGHRGTDAAVAAAATGGIWITFTDQSRDGIDSIVFPREGERIRITGKMQLPAPAGRPGGFNLQEYLARRGVFMAMNIAAPPEIIGPPSRYDLRSLAAAIRGRLEATLYRNLPSTDAGLLAGLVFGSRDGIPAAWQEDFRVTGVFHILTVSGAHVAMVAMPMLWALGWAGCSRRQAALAAIPALWIYCFVTGFGAPALRAALMISIFLGGQAVGRQSNGFNSLGLAALCLLILTPERLLDPGLQLSFLATWGILAFAGSIKVWLQRWLLPWPAKILAVTSAAILGTGPVAAAMFGQLSLVSPLANLIVAPAAALLIPLGLAAVFTGSALPVAAGPLFGLCSLLISLFVQAVAALARVPAATVSADPVPWTLVLSWYGGLVLWRWRAAAVKAIHRIQTFRLPLASRPAAALAFTLIPSLLSAGGLVVTVSGRGGALEIHLIDVGQGDAILVRFPGGTAILIDAGDAPGADRDGVDYGQAVVLPYLRRAGVRRLSALVITHPHRDHIGGAVAVVQGLPVAEIWHTGIDPDQSSAYAALLAAAGRRGIPQRELVAGRTFAPAAAAAIQILHPAAAKLEGTGDDVNANSAVLRIVYRDTAVLLAGDIEQAAEGRLLSGDMPVRAQVLKVAHHGSKTSSSESFLAEVKADVCLISTGYNSYGHPAAETLHRLQRHGCRVYRTDRSGTVIVRSDGRRLNVTEKRRGGWRAWGLIGAW